MSASGQAPTKIAQRYDDDPLARWIHELLHKIEGDAGNGRYWYSQTNHGYGDFADVAQEWAAIRNGVMNLGKGIIQDEMGTSRDDPLIVHLKTEQINTKCKADQFERGRIL